MDLKQKIELAWDNRALLNDLSTIQAIKDTIDLLDSGELRVAQLNESKWVVNEWVKKAVLLYFPIIRVVPSAISRHGSYISSGCILMPSYVNIGAYIGKGTMVDTWATVGSCAQIGENVHISGGVGIGGVLEPVQASPVIIEDNVFLGSRSIIVEGVIIRKEAVLGANVVLTASTKIIDVTNDVAKEIKGEIPERSVVIPGTVPKKFNAGTYNVPCALIIGKRKESTDKKTSLNQVLREHNLAV